MDGILMTKKELKTYRFTMNAIDGQLSISELSEVLGKSYRQTQRIVKKVKEKGELGVVHGNTGKVPMNKTSPEVLKEINQLWRTKYHDFNLIHFKEKLEEKEGIKIKYSTLYRDAKNKRLIKHQKRRSKKKYSTRPRMPQSGALVQFDGSEHIWFGNFKSDLIAAIDDATGKILSAEFFIGETSLHSMQVIKNTIENYGIPNALYTDEAAIYGKIDRDWQSQIKRALGELNCKLIIATSAQAKGRVERLFRTLQDRLIAELQLEGVRTVPAANVFLKEVFIPKFNKSFSIEARSSETAFSRFEGEDLDLILCRKVSRKITSGNTFSLNSTIYLIVEKKDYRFRTININTHCDGSISYDINGRKVEAEVFKRK